MHLAEECLELTLHVIYASKCIFQHGVYRLLYKIHNGAYATLCISE